MRYLLLVNLNGEERTVPVPQKAEPLLGSALQGGTVCLPPDEVGIYRMEW